MLGATVASIAAPAASLAATVGVVDDQPAAAAPRLKYTASPGETNTVTINLTGCAQVGGACTAGTYTVADSTATLSVDAADTAGCTGGGASVTCSATGTNRVGVVAGDMNDSVTMNAKPPKGTSILGEDGDDVLIGGPARDFIRGGPGADDIQGGAGNDDLDPGTVTPVNPDEYDPDSCTFHIPGSPCPDAIQGGAGFNTARFTSATGPVIVDERQSDSESVSNEAGQYLVHYMKGVSEVVGSQYDDQLYGGPRDDTLVGAGGADVLCGGYGNDTVDYSNSPGPVNVSLDAVLPPDPRWESTDLSQWTQARQDCRQTSDVPPPIHPVVDPQHPQDCSPNDGGDADISLTTGLKDCVGPDTENVVGSPYDDTLVGNSPGAYTEKAAFFEPRGMNILDGGPGNDFLDGRAGSDILIGGANTDTVSYAWETQPVKVTIDGAANDGSSADLNTDSGLGDSVAPDVENIVGGSGSDTLGGSAADNVISGGPGDDVLQGDAGNDTLDGEAGNDRVEGQAGDDQVHGGPDNDFLDGGFGADTLDGGDGSDTVDYSNATTPVYAVPDGIANDGPAGDGDNILGTVENLTGGSDNDTLVGNDGPGTLNGGPGNDTLDGGGGADHIIGGDGLDVASYAGRSGSVSVDLEASGGAGEPGENDSIDPDVEGVAGGAGNDTIAGSEGVNLLFGGGGNDTLAGRGGEDQIFGGDGNDAESGDAGSDTVVGDGGDDTLQGGADPDGLNGGEGNDQLDGGPGNDVFIGGPGNDTAMYSSRTKDVDVTLDGSDNDGESTEHDQIRATVESTKTGAGNDAINVRDGLAGDVTCGAGTDVVTADAVDKIADDCEQKNVGASAACSVRSKSLTMSGKGTVGVRITCPVTGKGTLTLATTGAYKAAKKTRKKVSLGRKSFKLKAGKSKTIKVKLSKKARRLVKKNKRLKTRATVSVKPASASKASKRAKTLTIKAPKKKKG